MRTAILTTCLLSILVEGSINHHILHVHHVVERLGLSVWDWIFLGSGVVLLVVGWLMIRSVPSRAEDRLERE